MIKIRSFVYFIVIGTLLASGCTAQVAATSLPEKSGITSTITASIPSSTATPEPTREIDPALLAAMEKCANTLPGQACLVEGPVQVEAKPDRYLTDFKVPGQTIVLADLQRLKLGKTGSIKGVVVMRIQTEWSGGDFTVLAIGDVELINEVPYGSNEFNPMQILTLTTGENEEDQPLINGLFVASPDDGNLSTLVVNSVELTFGSGGWLSGQGGGLNIRTTWGSIGTWFQDRVIQVKRGFGLRLTHDEIIRELEKEPYRDYQYDSINKLLEKYFGEKQPGNELPEKKDPYDPAYRTVLEALKRYFGCKDWETNPGCGTRDDAAADKKIRALQELRKKQKRWKGGWWKMTYGPVNVSGQCKTEPVGDGGTGGDGQPYSKEIPICRGNNGNTILMYESGLSYDRVGPNLFAKSFLSEFDLFGNGNSTAEGKFMTLQVVSPTRMILSNAGTEDDSCTTATILYLDYVRDDPNVRCGEIIYISPYETPQPPTPTPSPQNVDPPAEGQYQARIGMIQQACDPSAKPFAPSFATAGLSLSEENKLVVDAATTKYELEMSSLTYPYYSQKLSIDEDRLGIFTLQQPVDDTFGLMMTLVQLPGQQWSGSWLVTNEDASKLCGGSIDLLPGE